MHATASRRNILGEKKGIRFVSLASRDAIVIETPITDLVARARNSASGDRAARAGRIVSSFASSRARECVIVIKRSDPSDRRDHRTRADRIVPRAETRHSCKRLVFSENMRLFGGEGREWSHLRHSRARRGRPPLLVYASYFRSIPARAVIPVKLRMNMLACTKMFAEDLQDLKVIAISLAN